MRTRLLAQPSLFLMALSAATALPSAAQMSLPTAVNLALKNSPRVRVAQADVARARAVLSQSKDAFVPAVSANGGVGKSTGAPLGPPIVFSISAQSLVFNSSQADYIRAARAGLQSAQLALDAAQSDAAEDATNTYIALDNALQRQTAETAALGFAGRLVSITEDRFNAGIDPHIDLTKARQTEAQIHLQQLLIEDEIAEQAGHLARLTGLSSAGLTTRHDSIPVLRLPPPVAPAAPNPSATIGLSAAFAAATAKQYTAHGEKRYLLRPQVAFSANYSRISTAFTTYTQYYPYFAHAGNSFNSLNLGVEISVPILDMVHRAKYREAAADAAHAFADAQAQQMLFLDGRDKLRRSTTELAARRDLAELDRELAQDQLDAVLIRLRPDAGSVPGEPQLTPKDEANARLQESLRTVDMLNADLQLQQAEVMLLRQDGSLSNWLAATIPSATAAPAGASPAPEPPVPATVGMPPGGAAPAGSAPPPVPTTGTVPATQPAGPVTNPAPVNPPAAPPSTPPAPPQP